MFNVYALLMISRRKWIETEIERDCLWSGINAVITYRIGLLYEV